MLQTFYGCLAFPLLKTPSVDLTVTQPKPPQLTETELLPRVRGEGEAQDRHGGDQEARHDQVEKIVESSSSDLDGEGDIQVRFRATLVYNFISLGRNSFNVTKDINCHSN